MCSALLPGRNSFTPGFAKNISVPGMILDPMNLTKAFGDKTPMAAPGPDPATERAKVESDATAEANTKLANDKRMKRANVLAAGGSADALGALAASGKTSVLGGAGGY